MNFQPHAPIETKDGIVYDADYLLEPYVFGMRCLIHAQRSGEAALGFTVYFPPSFFGTQRVKHNTIVQKAFEQVGIALESKLDDVNSSQTKPTGYEINCTHA